MPPSWPSCRYACSPAKPRISRDWRAQFCSSAALPVLWIVLQLVPAGPLAHPIWQSASAALGVPSWGSISVAPGLTLLALGHLLTSIGIGFATMALTIDRRRAELCLLVLTMVTGLMALTIILHDLGGFTFLASSVRGCGLPMTQRQHLGSFSGLPPPTSPSSASRHGARRA